MKPDLESLIRDVPDFPKPGIVFKDITPLVGDAAGLRAVIDGLSALAAPRRPEAILCIEARGFLFGSALAVALGLGVIPARKPGKLPWRVRRVEYALEYGKDTIEIHADAIRPGARVLVVDDVLATGGTAAAAARLVAEAGGAVAGCLFVVELGFLGGRARLGEIAVDALIRY